MKVTTFTELRCPSKWEQLQDEGHAIFDGGVNAKRIDVPDTDPILMKELAHFTKREKIADQKHVSFLQGAGHGGSHPHLVQNLLPPSLKAGIQPSTPT